MFNQVLDSGSIIITSWHVKEKIKLVEIRMGDLLLSCLKVVKTIPNRTLEYKYNITETSKWLCITIFSSKNRMCLGV